MTPTTKARPEFLRRGTPILIPVGKRARTIGKKALCGGVGIDHDGVFALTDVVPEWVPLSEAEVDLSETFGRQSVMMALAEKLLTEDPSWRAGLYFWAPPPYAANERTGHRAIPGQLQWCLGSRFGGIYGRYFVPVESMCRRIGASRTGIHPDEDPNGDMLDPDWIVVPTLSGVDADDGTPLPDGSRLVDALALKLVAEHVFGMEEG